MAAARLDDLAALVEDDALVLGAAPAAPYAEAEAAIRDRAARGLFADMRFTMRQPERSCHPELLVRGARTVVSALLPVWRPAAPPPAGPVGRLPRYAWGDPYVRLREGLGRVRTAIARPAGGRWCSSTRTTTSTARARGGAASPSPGKNTMAIAPGLGSFVAIGTLVTDLDLASPRRRSRCTTAAAAARAASTRVRRARSTSRGSSTPPAASRTGRRAATARPRTSRTRSRTWSTAATSARTSARGTPAQRAARRGAPPDAAAWVSLVDWLEAPADELLARHARLYVPDRDARYLRRNALVALGNGPAEHRELALPFADGDDPLLRAVALRALGEAGR